MDKNDYGMVPDHKDLPGIPARVTAVHKERYEIVCEHGITYIEDDLQAEITAAELADMAGFSLFHYYRLFQRAIGLPVMQYILRRRLLHGVYAMKQGSSKVDAALAFGFDTYAGSYKAFCREFGSTPSDLLQACRAKRPYRIDITKEEHMTITHKKAAQILESWDLLTMTSFFT